MTQRTYAEAPYADTPDGETYEYRLVGARLERRVIWSRHWESVTGEAMLRMTPRELRVVADVIEGRARTEGGE